jgi:hypothetical protein
MSVLKADFLCTNSTHGIEIIMQVYLIDARYFHYCYVKFILTKCSLIIVTGEGMFMPQNSREHVVDSQHKFGRNKMYLRYLDLKIGS